MYQTRRHFLSDVGLLFLTALPAVGFNKLSSTPPKEPETGAEAIKEIYQPDDPNNICQLSHDYMDGFVEYWSRAPKIIKYIDMEGDVHLLRVCTAHVDEEPVVALYENGQRVGSAKVWQSKLTAHEIYAATDDGGPLRPKAKTRLNRILGLI